MRLFRRALRSLWEGEQPTSNRGVWFAGRFWTWEQLCRHWIFMGGTGRGKTFASEMLLEQYMRMGCSMMLTTVKSDDFDRIYRIAERAGQTHRILEITPQGPHRRNLIESLLEPDGDVPNAAQMLTMIGEVGSRSTGGDDAKFWDSQAERALISSIILCKEVAGRVSPAAVYDVLTTSPVDHAAAKSPEWAVDTDFDAEGKEIPRGLCAKLILAGYRLGLDDTSPAFLDATRYLLNELPGGGDRMRGGIIANVNNILGRFLHPPWRESMGTDTTMNAEMIDSQNKIAILRAPILRGHTPALLWQFSWTLDAELHCLRRKYEKGSPPFILCRDEVGWLMASGAWEAKIALVARSQGLSFLDIIQDIDSLLMSLNGQKNAAYSFSSNHGHKLLFGSDNAETNKYASGLIGTHKVLNFSGGCHGGPRQPTGNVLDDVLGVPQVSWSQTVEPIYREENFARNPVGVGVLLTEGFHQVIDFRKGK